MLQLDKLAYEVEPDLLYGRPGPNKSNWSLAHLRQHGILVIISLVDLDEQELREVRRLGFTHYAFSIEDKIHRPYKTSNDDLMHTVTHILEIIDGHIRYSQPVLVHCNSGKDRTGLVMGCYLMSRKGMSAKQALRALRRLKPDALTAKGFEQMLLVAKSWLECRSPR